MSIEVCENCGSNLEDYYEITCGCCTTHCANCWCPECHPDKAGQRKDGPGSEQSQRVAALEKALDELVSHLRRTVVTNSVAVYMRTIELLESAEYALKGDENEYNG